MDTFTVTIVTTITTDIIVEAKSASEARKIVKDYGIDIAVQDFPANIANITAKIKEVKLKK